jgi:bifunctional non-homologous end joining protein LigD
MPTYAAFGGWVISIIAGWFEVIADNDKSCQREQEFVFGGYTEPGGSRKYFVALPVGFYEGKKLKFGGRVGTGFSEKLFSVLFSELDKTQVEKCPFYNLPAAGNNRWDQ